MDRRDFIKLAGATGLALASPAVSTKTANAQELYEGKFLVVFGASGGWDPTSFADPKGRMTEEETNPMNQFFMNADIGNTGNIRWAPGTYYQTFVENHYQDMLVFNGIDSQTNGHDSGRRHTGSGKLDENFPSIGAMMAAVHGEGLPMAFIDNGFYTETAGVAPKTRAGNTRVFERIADPNRVRFNDRTYHTTETYERIQAAQASRLEALRGLQQLPKIERSMGTLHMAREGDGILQRLLEFLPENNDGSQLERQSRLAIAAYKAGACTTATLSMGGFDTHGQHDNNQLPRLDQLWQGVDFFLREAEAQGIRDKIVVLVGSDFGRTPRYNDGNGKDHWSVTSMVAIGDGIRGDRTIGETTHEHGLKNVDPNSLAVVESGGIRIEPGHIHWALRRLVGIDGTDIASAYPLGVTEYLDLFS